MHFVRGFVTLLLLFSSLFVGSAWGSGTAAATGGGVAGPVVRLSERNDVSIPLGKLATKVKLAAVAAGEAKVVQRGDIPRQKPPALRPLAADPAVQRAMGVSAMPSPAQNFEGINNRNNVLPPDTVGAVGPNHYLQMVNLSLQVFDKSGASLLGPVDTNTIWSGLGGVCETSNDGDPIVVYDRQADRWLISQFAVPGGSDGYHECIAVSQTADPTGSWYRYDFLVSADKMNDYPKIGVWPDGYYMSVNQFTGGSSWGGAGAAVFERDMMLTGQPARMIYFDIGSVNLNFGGMLPATLDGESSPPAGAPNVFAEFDDDAFGFSSDQIALWEFHADWITPANSTFGADPSFSPSAQIATAPFDSDMCGYQRSCIPQPGTDSKLDAISDRLMFRLPYRNFGDHQTILLNHTVDENGSDHAGIRWYELRKGEGGWGIHQQGTYAPDGEHRWMGSIAMDRDGNIALGYSVASATVNPSIRYAGRLAGDDLNTFGQAEQTLVAGTGSQTHSAARWGDYSALTVDPADDCTFWYTQEYYQNTSSAGWQTRIGSFKYPGCNAGPTGTLSGTVTVPGGGAVPQAMVTAGGFSTVTSGSGAYTFQYLPVGTYTVSAQKYGYSTATANNVAVVQDTPTTRNFTLTAIPPATVSGTVSDGSGHGWPLAATIAISAAGFSTTVSTDPITGAYSIQLLQGIGYTFSVAATGYTPVTRRVTPSAGGSTESFALSAASAGGCPLGYQYLEDMIFYEGFDGGALPAGWTNLDNAATGNLWSFNDPGERGNLTGGIGSFAIADSDHAGETAFDSELRTPVVDLTGVENPVLEFMTDFAYYETEIADVDVSVNGAAGPWTTVWTKSGEDYNGQVIVDIGAIAANQANVMVRFHYHNANWEWWWQVDEVRIYSPSCQSVPGGMVKGYISDANTASGIRVATVAANTGQSAATVSLPAGLYSLFLPAGSYTLTASSHNYQTATAAGVSVAVNANLHLDFSLAAGLLNPGQSSITLNQYAHLTGAYPLTIGNSGAISATFALDQQRVTGAVIDASGTPNPWVAVSPSMPLGVQRAAGAAVDGKFYVIGGGSAGDQILGTVQRYDPVAGSWDTGIAPMPTPTSNMCAVAIGSDIYVAGGLDSTGQTAVNALQVLHTATGIWETVTTDPLPEPHWGGACTAYQNRLYLFDGVKWEDPSWYFSTVTWVYDPASAAGSRWSVRTPPPMYGYLGSAISAGGKIFLTGLNRNGDSRNVLAYDPQLDTWGEYPSLQTPRSGVGVWVLDDILYVGGGGGSLLTSVEQYDLSLGAGGAWSFVGAFQANNAAPNKPLPIRNAGLGQGRYAFVSATDTVTGRLYAAAGWNGVPLDSAESSLIAPAPWLAMAPLQGSINPGGSQPVSLNVDTRSLTPGTTQRGRIALMGNTPYGVHFIPVTLNVLLDSQAPTVDAFALLSPATVADIPVTTFTVSDNAGVTGYLITESAAAPLASDPGWSGTKPSTCRVATPGTKTLYAWARDAQGNVSAGKPATSVVSDNALPAVDNFSVQQNISNYLQAAITQFNASDNFGVTGYLITESPSKPAAGAAGWSASAPAFYTFASAGSKTLYAWAKDASANVSNGRTATITLLKPVRIEGPPVAEFPKIQDAYNAIAGSSDTMRVWGSEFVEAVVNFSDQIDVFFRGGYNTTYSGAPTGMTVIRGSLVVGRGSVDIDRLTIR